MKLIRTKNHKLIGKQEIVFQEKGDMAVCYYPELEKTGLVKHCFSTRLGGVSEGIFASMNLSFTRGDADDAVKENYQRIAKWMDIDPSRIVASNQTHTTNIKQVTKEDCGKGFVISKDYTDVDGLITNIPGITLVTIYADCVPLYFIDPVHKAIGLSHSGWRGTVHKMGEATLKKMKEVYGTEASDVICAIGPSICQSCYEVSEDVAIEFSKAFLGHESEIMYKKDNGKYQLDLWKANEIVLTDAGVLPEHISVTDLCTCCNPDVFFSHRASQGKRGNLGAFLCLKK